MNVEEEDLYNKLIEYAHTLPPPFTREGEGIEIEFISKCKEYANAILDVVSEKQFDIIYEHSWNAGAYQSYFMIAIHLNEALFLIRAYVYN